MSRRPKLFISYADDDKGAALKLAGAVQAEGLDAWLDREQLAAGDDLRGALEQAIGQSNGVVFLVTDSSSASPWVKQEGEAALTGSWENPGIKLIPVVAQGAQPPGFLRDRTWIKLPSPDAHDEDWSRAAREIRDTLVHGGKHDAYYRQQARKARLDRLEQMRVEIAPLVQAEMSKTPAKD